MQTPYKLNFLSLNKKPIGLNITLAPDQTSFFSQTFTTIDQYKTNIKHLLLTSKGERRMLTTYGSDLKKRLFEQDINLSDFIRNDIESALNDWIPEVKVQSINIYKDDKNDHSFLVKLFFTLPFNTKNIEQVDLEIS